MTADIRFELDPSLGALARQIADEINGRLSGIPGVSVTLQRASPTAQDMGTTLGVVLGAPAAIVLAKAVFEIARQYGAGLRIVTRNGTVIATGDAARNLSRQDVANVLAELVPSEDGPRTDSPDGDPRAAVGDEGIRK